jgi:mRNA interferase RelE/StbE
MYRLVVPKEIQELVRKMHPDLKRKVRASLRIIVSELGSGKALMDELAGLRSFRVRSFRIIYRIADAERIELVAVGPRRRIYEETMRILRRKKREPGKVTKTY